MSQVESLITDGRVIIGEEGPSPIGRIIQGALVVIAADEGVQNPCPRDLADICHAASERRPADDPVPQALRIAAERRHWNREAWVRPLAGSVRAEWLLPEGASTAAAFLIEWWIMAERLAAEGKAPDAGDYAPRQSAEYLIHTSQEYDALLRAACDGRTGKHWKSNPKTGTRSHALSDLKHYVQLSLTAEEIADGVEVNALERLTFAQDADCAFALLYISSLLAPPSPLPPNAYAGGWIDLDDVLERVISKPRSTQERETMRQKVWDYLRFGARATVRGKRTGRYYDRHTGKEIETEIDGPLWSFMDQERPAHVHLFASVDVPLRIEVVVSKDWTQLTTAPDTAQYLPMGALLGGIPPNQPSGAWARVIGLALANFWRRNPRAALDGSLKPTRRELLDRYTPKVSPPVEVLGGKNPRRAIDYWYEALQVLVQSGYLSREGEAARRLEDTRTSVPRQNWKDVWLDEHVQLLPGPRMQGPVRASAEALPPSRPRALRGRPGRKTAPAKRRTAEPAE